MKHVTTIPAWQYRLLQSTAALERADTEEEWESAAGCLLDAIAATPEQHQPDVVSTINVKDERTISTRLAELFFGTEAGACEVEFWADTPEAN